VLTTFTLTRPRTVRVTECNCRTIAFSPVGRRQVVVDFEGGRITSDAGLLLLREVDRLLGLIDAINECIPDPRDPLLTVHQQREKLSQRIFSLALGSKTSTTSRPCEMILSCNWPPENRPNRRSHWPRRPRCAGSKTALTAGLW
jgi:hypothetical protein